MTTRMKLLAAATAITAALSLSTQAHAAKCLRVAGWGTGALQNFASFMSEAAMKNSAKSHLGDAAKIGPARTKCEVKGLLWECTSAARACK